MSFKFVDVVDLKPLEGFRLWLKFSDGREGVRDFADILAEPGSMVAPLRDAAFFARVYLDRTVPAWPNGYALDASTLYAELEAANVLTSSIAAE